MERQDTILPRPGRTDPAHDEETSAEDLRVAFDTLEKLFDIAPHSIAPEDLDEDRKNSKPIERFAEYQLQLAAALKLVYDSVTAGDRQYFSHSGFTHRRVDDVTDTKSSRYEYVTDDSGEMQRPRVCTFTINLEHEDCRIILTGTEGDRKYSDDNHEFQVIIPTAVGEMDRLVELTRPYDLGYLATEPNFYDAQRRQRSDQKSMLSNGGTLIRSIDDFEWSQGGRFIYGIEGTVYYRPGTTYDACGAERFIEIERELIARLLHSLPEHMRGLMSPKLAQVAECMPGFTPTDPSNVTVDTYEAYP